MKPAYSGLWQGPMLNSTGAHGTLEVFTAATAASSAEREKSVGSSCHDE